MQYSWLAVLSRVAAELIARIRATTRYLAAVSPADGGQYKRLVDTVLGALRQTEETLLSTIAGVAELLSAANAHDAERVLLAEVNRSARRFATLHELVVYLPASSVKPETRAILERAFGTHYQDLAPTLILGTIFNALEFDFLGVIKNRLPDLDDVALAGHGKTNIVLQLPLCDRDSPLAWAVLAHEMGHVIDEHFAVADGVLADLGHTAPVLSNWAKEICADLIAASVLGPAPMLSILNLEYCLYPGLHIHVPSKTHPTTRWRAELVRQLLRGQPGGDQQMGFEAELELYGEAWEYSLRRATPDPAQQAQLRTNQDVFFSAVLRPIAAGIQKRIEAIGDLRCSLLGPAELQRCLSRLSKHLPVSAQGTSRPELRRALTDFRSITFSTRGDQVTAFQRLLPLFRERPLGATEVLAACHSRRRQVVDEYRNRMARTGELGTEAFSQQLQTLDDLIASSITTTIVHERYDQELALDGAAAQ